MTISAAPHVDDRTAFRHAAAYRQIIRGRMQLAILYRQSSLLMLLLLIVQIFVLIKVWTALYAGDPGRTGIDQLIGYLTIANLQGWVLSDPSVAFYMYERVREGRVAFDLVRPMGFVKQMFAHLVGSRFATFVFILPAVPLFLFTGALRGPVSWSAAMLYAVSLAAGYVISMLMTLMLGMVAFWTLEVQGLSFFFVLVHRFLGGAMVPLTLFPRGLEALASWLPFQATTYTPVAIYVGRLTGRHAIAALAVQAVWVVLLSAGAHLMWKRAIHRVVVQGG